jgi:hypothetical protein
MAILPVFCCGFECGLFGAVGQHWATGGSGSAPTFITSGHRSGLRAARFIGAAGLTSYVDTLALASSTRWVGRFYVYFNVINSGSPFIASIGSAGPRIYLVGAESKLYSAVNTAIGGNGITVTTGVWYCIDFDFNINTGGNDTCDIKVNGVSTGQATGVGDSAGTTTLRLGAQTSDSGDFVIDDVIISHTAADYPLGGGYVLSYIPNADGTHNVASANDFERFEGGVDTGTDIINSTTTAWQLVDKRPLTTTIGDAIAMEAPPNTTDFVEVLPEDSVESAGPRAVEVIAAIHQAGTGEGNMAITLVGAFTHLSTIYSATTVAGSTSIVFKREQFPHSPPSSGGPPWVIGGGGQGDFNSITVRFGSPVALDVNPDQYLDGLMIEAEYAEVIVIYRELSISPPPYLQVTRVVAY